MTSPDQRRLPHAATALPGLPGLAGTRGAWEGEHSALTRSFQELIRRAAAVSEQRRVTARGRRTRVHEHRRRADELRTGETRVERLFPHLSPPPELPVRMHLPAGQAASALLCGICDEVLATGIHAADLTVTLRCRTCLGYNTAAPPAGPPRRTSSPGNT